MPKPLPNSKEELVLVSAMRDDAIAVRIRIWTRTRVWIKARATGTIRACLRWGKVGIIY